MGFSFGKGKEKSSSENSQTSRVVLPDYLQGPVENAASNVNDLSMREYTPYGGQAVAGFSDLQNQAFGLAEGNQGQYGDLFGQASNLAMQGAQGVDPNSISNFMNPYQQNVIDIAKRDTLSDHDLRQNEFNDQMANIGAFGGSRMGIQQEEIRNNTGQRLDDLQYRGQADNWNQALGASFQNANLMNQGAQNVTNVAMAGQQYANNDIQALMQAGGMQQANQQAQNSFDLSQFQEGRQWDYDTGQFGVNNLATLGGLTRGENLEGTGSSAGKSSSMGFSFAEGGLVSGLAEMYKQHKEDSFMGPKQPDAQIGSGGPSAASEEDKPFSLKDFLFQKALSAGGGGQSGGTGQNTGATNAQAKAEQSKDDKGSGIAAMFGFKEGGEVQNYAEGGLTDFLSRFGDNVGKVANDKVNSLSRMLTSTYGYDILTDPTFANYMEGVDKRLDEVIAGSSQEGYDDFVMQEEEAARGYTAPQKSAGSLGQPAASPEDLAFMDMMMAEEEGQRGVRKQDEPVDALEQTLMEIKDKQTSDTPSRYAVDPSQALLDAPEKSLGDLIDPNAQAEAEVDPREKLSPTRAFWGSALANSQRGLFGAIGAGLQGYNQEKYISEGQAYERKQQAFDNKVSQVNSDSTALNSKVALQSMMNKSRMAPLQQQKLLAEIEQAKQKAAIDPVYKMAFDKYDPVASFGKPPGVVIDELYQTILKTLETSAPRTGQYIQQAPQENQRLVYDADNNVLK